MRQGLHPWAVRAPELFAAAVQHDGAVRMGALCHLEHDGGLSDARLAADERHVATRRCRRILQLVLQPVQLGVTSDECQRRLVGDAVGQRYVEGFPLQDRIERPDGREGHRTPGDDELEDPLWLRETA